MNPLIQLRGAYYPLVLVVVCAIPFALAQRNATKPRRGQARQREQSVGAREQCVTS